MGLIIAGSCCFGNRMACLGLQGGWMVDPTLTQQCSELLLRMQAHHQQQLITPLVHHKGQKHSSLGPLYVQLHLRHSCLTAGRIQHGIDE